MIKKLISDDNTPSVNKEIIDEELIKLYFAPVNKQNKKLWKALMETRFFYQKQL